MKFTKYVFALMAIIFVNNYAIADPEHLIPPEYFIGLIALFLLLGTAISLVVSVLLRFVFQKVRKEKRKHIWFMTSLTFILPTTFVLLEEEYHLLYDIDPYETRLLVSQLIIIGLVFVGFLLGYFFTPKKSTME
ncbi:MAG: hypothetical protein HWE22_19385 [Flavobacteriales bacterium]|nr:hypothetical protein [Flavobacteriales bacterium]